MFSDSLYQQVCEACVHKVYTFRALSVQPVMLASGWIDLEPFYVAKLYFSAYLCLEM